MKSLLAILISSALVVSGYSQTRNVLVNTNNVVVQPTNFWSVDASNARTGLGLGTAATNPASAFQPSSGVLSNLASSNAVNLTNLRATNIVGTIPASNIPSTTITNIPATNIVGTVALASNVTGTIAISNGGTGATNAGGARTNLGLGSTNDVAFNIVDVLKITSGGVAPTYTLDIFNGSINFTTNPIISWGSEDVYFFVPLFFTSTTNAATTRTNLGLGWAALTNTSASGFGAALYGSNTNPVLVNTSGQVVSPTNFWQVAPILTLVQDFTGVVTNQTNNITNARSVYVYSLATNVSSISNTLLLPTNAATFAGDEVTVTHRGTTNTTTVVRQAGSTNNLITLSRFDESVKFIRELGQWDFYHNISFVEPVQFSGTNAAANAAASRTNLGLGTGDDVSFDKIQFDGSDSNVPSFAGLGIKSTASAFGGFYSYYDGAYKFAFAAGNSSNSLEDTVIFRVNSTEFAKPINFVGTNISVITAQTRTNLGLGETNNVTFNDVTASGTLTATSTVTAKTNLEVQGFVDFTTNRAATNGPTNAGNFNTHAVWITIKAGTNTYFLPAYK